MSIENLYKMKSKRQSLNTVNSNILNSANVNTFERLVNPVNRLTLMYRLSDYNRNGYPSECYTQFRRNYVRGMSYNLVILCKSQEGKVFGLYIPRCNYYTKEDDKLKPYIFSLDMNRTIGNTIESSNSYVFDDRGENYTGLIIDIEGYQLDLFNNGYPSGFMSTTIENVQRYNRVIYDMCTSYICQEDNELHFMINYQEMEVYQITDDIDYVDDREIIITDNRNIFENLAFPLEKLRLVQTLKYDGYYLNGKINIGQLYNTVIIVKTISGKTFGVYKKGNEVYFYSVDLNEKYSLTSANIIIGIKTIVIKSNELCLKLSTDNNCISYIGFNNKDSFYDINIIEVVGEIKQNINALWHIGNNYNNAYEFKWLEIDVYEIKD